MQTINENAKILSVEIDEALRQSNELNAEKGLFSARLTFCYLSTSSVDADGIDEEAQTLLGQMKGGNTFSVLINLSRANVPNGQDVLSFVKSKLEGKIVRMTTFVCKISELSKNKFDRVYNPDNNRIYSSLNNSFVGNYTDKDGVFNAMHDRLKSDIVNGNLVIGEPETDEEPEKKDDKLNF